MKCSSYCSLEHGHQLFPDIITHMTRTNLDPWSYYELTRKNLCLTMDAHGMTCDPSRCADALYEAMIKAHHSDNPRGTWGWAMKQCVQYYYDEQKLYNNERFDDSESVIAQFLKGMNLKE